MWDVGLAPLAEAALTPQRLEACGIQAEGGLLEGQHAGPDAGGASMS